MKSIVDEIEASLNAMEASGKVDLGVLKIIDKLRKPLAAIKSRWLREPDTDGFYFYHAVRSTELILDRMVDRFKNAARAGDNPKVAEDSLAVMDPMRDLMGVVDADSITDGSINSVLDRTYELLTAASGADLRESIETRRAMIDKDLIKPMCSDLAKKIKEI